MAGSKAFWRGCGAGLALAITFACASVQSSKAQTPSRSSPDASLTGAAQRGQQPQPQLRANHLDTAAVKPSTAGPRDGDLVATYTPPDLRDGLLTQSDPLVVEDGLDPTNTEHRPPSEQGQLTFPAGLLAPPDGDALLFQIDEIRPLNPALNRRPARFATLEPYDPIGIKIVTFVLFPEAEIAGLRASNVFASPDGQSYATLEFAPRLRLVSNWSRHALEFLGFGNLSNYRRFGSENYRGFGVESRGRLDITRHTNLQAAVRRERTQEDRSAVDASQAGPHDSVKTDLIAGSFNHRFYRLSIQLSGGLSDKDYSAASSTSGLGGAVPSTADRDYAERTAAVRATWEFKPTFRVLGEYGGNDRNFDVASSTDGLSRDS